MGGELGTARDSRRDREGQLGTTGTTPLGTTGGQLRDSSGTAGQQQDNQEGKTMEQHNMDHAFTEQDWTEMEDAHECDGKVDGCDGCAFCAPMDEYTHQQEYQAAVMFSVRAMARRLGLTYLDPRTAGSMWSAVPNLPSIVARGDLETLAVLIREHSPFDPWEHPYVPESIQRMQARREGGRK